jgi:hypothetical protein
MFKNVAPVVPEDTLSALERALANPKDAESVAKCGSYVNLLRSLVLVQFAEKYGIRKMGV